MNKRVINYAKHKIFDSELRAVSKVLKSNYLTQGPKINEFEDKIKDYCKSKYAVAVNSATSALHISCLLYRLKSTDIVWTSPNSFVASANCALYCGAKIDFVDIDPETYNISIKDLERKLLKAKSKKLLPKILIVVHHGGNPVDLKRVYQLSIIYKFKIIEDASHALGSEFDGNKIGSCKYSDLTIFSFHPIKTITSCEGGMILTKNKKNHDELKLLREHGINRDYRKFKNKKLFKWQYEQITLGYNYRMSDIHAAIGIAQLKNIKKILLKRNKIAKLYNSKLSNYNLNTQLVHRSSFSSYHLFTIILPSEKIRNKILKNLRVNNINASIVYNPIYLNPYYKKIGFRKGYCKHAEDFSKKSISLPIYYDLQQNDLMLIIKIITNKLNK